MSLEQAIHERWQGSTELAALLPATRFTTGSACGAVELPYAVLGKRENQLLSRSSSGTTFARAVVRITIHSVTLEQGAEINQAIARRFDRCEFSWGTGDVLNMQRSADFVAQAEDGSWGIDMDFVVFHVERKAEEPGP